jgi:two-component system, OmpR family, response regulator
MVEDDLSFARLVQDWLTFQHHRVDHAQSSEAAIKMLLESEFDLLIFDVELPGQSGIELLSKYRASGGTLPVLILTGQKQIERKVEGFSQGADDYLTKPFEPEELSMRVMALLRRPPLKFSKTLKVSDLELDLLTKLLKVSGSSVELDPIELSMLEFFMRNTNQVFSPEELIASVWATAANPTEGAVATCIKRLRKKIDSPNASSHVRTVYGAGYCMDEKESE